MFLTMKSRLGPLAVAILMFACSSGPKREFNAGALRALMYENMSTSATADDFKQVFDSYKDGCTESAAKVYDETFYQIRELWKRNATRAIDAWKVACPARTAFILAAIESGCELPDFCAPDPKLDW